MNYYSDPTASKAIGNINREFLTQIKKAKKLYKLYSQGKLSQVDLERERKQFKGLYRYVLDNIFEEEQNK